MLDGSQPSQPFTFDAVVRTAHLPQAGSSSGPAVALGPCRQELRSHVPPVAVHASTSFALPASPRLHSPSTWGLPPDAQPLKLASFRPDSTPP